MQGGYFMSDEDQDAVVGRLFRDYKENDELLTKLEAEAERIGMALESVGRALKSHPEGVMQEHDSCPLDLMNRRQTYNPSLFDAARIKQLTDQYRQALETLGRIGEHLRALGHTPQRAGRSVQT